jgi:hypothetical protein
MGAMSIVLAGAGAIGGLVFWRIRWPDRDPSLAKRSSPRVDAADEPPDLSGHG